MVVGGGEVEAAAAARSLASLVTEQPVSFDIKAGRNPWANQISSSSFRPFFLFFGGIAAIRQWFAMATKTDQPDLGVSRSTTGRDVMLWASRLA